ncbi:peroxidase-like [Eurosta solidaginis]|uniref:peroxidase-like n=1 Tax=Eurosta solidaginis TaxID=178769 RepID=UPI0035317B39
MKTSADMGSKEKLYICATLTLFLANGIVANHESRCPFTSYHEYEEGQPDEYFSSSAAAALAEVDVCNANGHGKRHSSIHLANSIAPSLHDLLFNIDKADKLQYSLTTLDCTADTNNFYYRTYDGACNNFENPDYGMAKSTYTRMMAPKYSDGYSAPPVSLNGSPLPNARQLSLALYGDTSLPDDFRTMAFLHFGQFVAHDMTNFAVGNFSGDCCLQPDSHYCFPIFLHPLGPIAQRTSKRCWNFIRSAFDTDAIYPKRSQSHAKKISTTSAYLDLSYVYGDSLEQNRKYRLFKGGQLKTMFENRREWLPLATNPESDCKKGNYQCFDLPEKRNRFLPTSTVMHTIMVREHNRIARILQKINPHYTDERLFQEARKINIAQYQQIVYYHWLPLLLGSSYAYANNIVYHITKNEHVYDYEPTVNAAPFAEFAAGAFRYSHNQIPGWFTLVSSDRYFNKTLRLSNHFERSEDVNWLLERDNFDSLIRGMSMQLQKRSDSNIDKEVRHYFAREPMEEYGFDLKALDIQRARDFGLPSYNDMRVYCGLPRAYDWSGFSSEISKNKILLMQQLYATPEDVDLSIGGSLEAHTSDAIVGPTFQCIIAKQFLKSRKGDRFFFERFDPVSGFSRDQLAEIRKASLSQLLCNNADFLQDIQENVFVVPNSKNPLWNCKDFPQINLSKWKSAAAHDFN